MSENNNQTVRIWVSVSLELLHDAVELSKLESQTLNEFAAEALAIHVEAVKTKFNPS